MIKSFNLLEEPWIPCLRHNNPKPVDHSLIEVVRDANSLRAIHHASPIVTLVLHRFVMAFLYRALQGPRSVSGVRSILKAGCFDPASLEKYATDCRERFWLFHPKRPFLQDPRLPEELSGDSEAPLPIFQLFREAAAPAGKLLFDHTVAATGQGVSVAEAARYLLADQLYGLQDGRGYTPSMLSFGAAILVAGQNLFETLALNLVPYNSESPIKSPNLRRDMPFWERDEFDPKPFPAGWLDYLTRPYRRLLLVAPDNSNVTHVYRKSAVPVDREWRDQASDPWIAYRVTDKGAKAVALRTDRALWRDSHALIQQVAGREVGAPGYVNLLARLEGQGAVHAFGVVADNNQVDLWRHERLPLPVAYLQKEELLGKLQRSIQLSEGVRNILAGQLSLMARDVLIPNSHQLSEVDQRKQWAELTKRPGRKKSRLDAFFETLGWESPYWAALDPPFRKLIVDLAKAWPGHEEETPLRAWADDVRNAARHAFEEAARVVETSGRGLRAAAEARGRFGALLHQKLDSFLPSSK